MNHVYKTIWNEQTGTYVAVSEHKRARGKRSGSVKAAVAGAVLATGALAMGSALAATGINGGTGAGTAISECKDSTQAQAGKKNSIAIGCNSLADGKDDGDTSFFDRKNPHNKNLDTSGTYQSVAIGTGAKAKQGSVALGHGAQAADGESALAVAIGSQAKAQNVASLAIGPAALATGNTALAMGRQTAATADFAQAIGNVAAATGLGSLAVGHSATATGKRSIAIGAADIDNAGSTGAQNGTVYMEGEQTLATGQDAIAFGAAANAKNNYSLAIGAHSEASGLNSTAMGYQAKATGENTFASGAGSIASGKDAFALGAHSEGLGDRSFAMGPNAKAIGENALALGSLSEAHEKNSIAVGVGAKANFADSVALGSKSSVDHKNSIAIGTESTTNDYTTHEAFLYESGAAGAIATGAVSIGNGAGSVVAGAGNERRLQNVAAGGADTDAVNVSQLKMHKAITDKTGGDLAENLGGGSTYDPKTGEVSNPTYNIGDTNYNNVGDALLAARTVVKAGKNIGVEESKGTAGQTIFTVKTQEDLDLTSVTTGHAVMNNDGFNVVDGSNSSTVGAGNISVKDDAGTTVIAGNQMTVGGTNSVVVNGDTGTIGGLTNKTFDPNSFTSGQAATEDQLAKVSGDLTAKGLNFSANAGGPLTSKLGSTVTVAGAQTNTDWSKFDAGQNIMTQIEQDASGNSAIRVALSKDITGLETIILGENGTPGKDGANGQAGVGLNGKDGSIGMTGKDGAGADLTVAMGAPGLAGNDGADGKSKTRLVYEKSDGSIEEVATLNDGLRFVGDDGKVVERKLNETLGLVGGADVAALTENNIGVVQKDDGSLGIQLAENVKGLNTVQVGGDTGPVLGGDAAGNLTLNPAGNAVQITNVASGLGGQNLADITGDDLLNATNVGDLKTVAGELTDAGLKFSANDGGPLTSKLGSTVTVAGAQSNTDWTKFDAGQNIMTQIEQDADGNSAIRVALSKDITGLETIILGENGTPGKDGANGQAGVGLNGKDGSIGITGKDGAGADLTVAMGAPGLAGNDGADGKSKTRLVYEKSDGSVEEVATLNDGLRFVGDDGKVVERKLNETLGLVGGADVAALTEDNIGVVQKDDGSLGIQLAENVKGLNTVQVGGDTGPVLGGDAAGNLTLNPTGNAVQITNVASGLGGQNLADITGDDLLNVTNVGDLQAATGGLTDKGLVFGANDGGPFTSKLGSTVTVAGAQTNTDWSKFDAGQNIMTQIEQDASGNSVIRVALSKDIDLGADGSLKAGNTVVNNDGLTVDDDAGNKTTTTAAGTMVTNAAGDKTTVGAGSITVVDADGYNTAISSTQVVVGGANPVTINGATGTIGGLANKTFDPNKFTSGQAATEDQLKQVSDVASAGWNVTDADGNSANIGPNGFVTFVGDENITVAQTGDGNDGKVEVKLNKDIDLGADGSLKTGDTVINNAGVAVGNDVHLGNTGLTINNGPSITLAGINAGDMRITNVAAGRNPTDAVNYGQLQPIESFIGLDGNGSFAYNGGQHSSLKDVLDSMHWNVEAPTDGKEGGNTGGSNGNGSGSTGGGNNGSGDGTPIHNGNTVGFVEGDNIVISKTDRINDAGQTVGADIKVSVSQDLKVNSITAVNVQADEIQINNGGPIINENGINMSGKHITNVAAGVNDTDAVNVSQLNQVAGNLQGQINNIRHDINRLDNRLSAGVAAAMATASLPQAYLPGKHMMSMAGGTWRGESGMAIGFSGITDNGKWVYKLSGNTTSRGDYGGAVGIGYQW
ncbi:YadA-like family protein [Alcaligenes faecalis]|uniref:YadA-like family protein n=3 Tax=Alcaligenes faecalis TaxID=511 RepID=UPI002040BB87|nr:YadA-like family protein [Alcaligenes faecalis]